MAWEPGELKVRNFEALALGPPLPVAARRYEVCTTDRWYIHYILVDVLYICMYVCMHVRVYACRCVGVCVYIYI